VYEKKLIGNYEIFFDEKDIFSSIKIVLLTVTKKSG